MPTNFSNEYFDAIILYLSLERSYQDDTECHHHVSNYFLFPVKKDIHSLFMLGVVLKLFTILFQKEKALELERSLEDLNEQL